MPRPKKTATGKKQKGTLTKKQLEFLSALRDNLGIISKAADQVNIHRNTHYLWCNTNEKYKEEVDAIENDCIDVVENALMSNILAGDVASIIFYLKTKAKKRGYIEKSEVEHSGSVNAAPIIIDWSEDEPSATRNKTNPKAKGSAPGNPSK